MKGIETCFIHYFEVYSVTYNNPHQKLQSLKIGIVLLMSRPKVHFKSFKHEHVFISEENGATLMIDIFEFQSPFGIFEKLANLLFLKRYMTNLLTTRNMFLKQKAEKLAQNR
jgi:hypothetical protein